MKIYANRLLTAKGFEEKQVVTVENGTIKEIAPADKITEKSDLEVEVLSPGLIDLHCHGGEGFNTKDCDAGEIEPFLNKMFKNGVTDVLLTTSAADKETTRQAMEVTRQVMELQKKGELGGTRVMGVHLEGPFLSIKRPGAMNVNAALKPSIAAYQELFDGYEDIIHEITLAPEEEGADELIAYLLKKGVKVQAGHTYATYDEAVHAFELGVDSLCHTFNACREIHHREPGIVVAALLNSNVYAEAICDLVHLHPAIIKMIYQAKTAERMIAISDSTYGNGLPDGTYFLEAYHLVVKDGISRTSSGALSGGRAYLGQTVKNLISIGIPPEDAIQMATKTPANRMNYQELGTIEVGKKAHLSAWDQNWNPVFAMADNIISK